MARRVYDMKREHIALFARIVKREAEKGDRAARSIIENAAESLSRGVLAVAGKMGLTPEDELNIYFVGGMFKHHSDMLTRSILKHLSSKCIKVNVKKPAYSPTVGALMIAFMELNVSIPSEVLNNAEKRASGAQL